MINSNYSNTRQSFRNELAESLSWNYGQQTIVHSVATTDNCTFPANKDNEHDNTWETTAKNYYSSQERESLIESAEYLKKKRAHNQECNYSHHKFLS